MKKEGNTNRINTVCYIFAILYDEKIIMIKTVLTFVLAISLVFSLYSQQEDEPIISDSLSSDEIIFSPESASEYLDKILQTEHLWKPENDSIITLLSRLADHYNLAFDSIQYILSNSTFNSGKITTFDSLIHDTLKVRWLNNSTFIIDTVDFEQSPVFIQKTITQRIVDSVTINQYISKRAKGSTNSIVRHTDTIIAQEDYKIEKVIDTAAIKSKNLVLYKTDEKLITPNILLAGGYKSYHFAENDSRIILSKPVRLSIADYDSPFFIVPNTKVPDSLNAAVKTLLLYANQRDSILVYLNNRDGYKTPFWLTSNDDDPQRYWIKNNKDDSVSIWMGNSDKKNISLILEDEINVEHIKKYTIDLPFDIASPTFNLAEVKPLDEIPIFWDFDFSSSVTLSQNYLSNWSKGGASSLANLIDVNGQAKYTNERDKTEWTNNIRFKYGSVLSEEHGVRKNTDILQFDSKFNKSFRKKVAYSSTFHWKDQIADGYSYPNDSVVVSKFLNPSTFTVGLGLEYKPAKKSTINFSVISYKNTFVLDTAQIDQTIHGIDKNQRARQEMGGQLLINSEVTVFRDLNISNSLRLFSNYLEKPQNVDVDWEINLEKQISLYFTVKLNVHMIYDDDIRLPKRDDNNNPILDPDGNEILAPMLQFKQFLGLTFIVHL